MKTKHERRFSRKTRSYDNDDDEKSLREQGFPFMQILTEEGFSTPQVL